MEVPHFTEISPQNNPSIIDSFRAVEGSPEKNTEDYDDLFTLEINKDLNRVSSIYIDDLIDKVGGYTAKSIAYRKDYIMKLVNKKLECLVRALQDQSKDRWLGLLHKSREDMPECDHFDKCLKIFQRLHLTFHSDFGKREKLRTFSKLMFEVIFYFLIYRTVLYRNRLRNFLDLLVVSSTCKLKVGDYL